MVSADVELESGEFLSSLRLAEETTTPGSVRLGSRLVPIGKQSLDQSLHGGLLLFQVSKLGSGLKGRRETECLFA